MAAPENTTFDEFNLDLFAPPSSQNNAVSWQKCVNFAVPKVVQPPFVVRKGETKRSRLAGRIADNDVLVRQLKNLQEHNKKLTDLQRTSAEVTELFHKEKLHRIEQERRVQELKECSADLEKKLEAQILNCENLQEQITHNEIPVDNQELICSFIRLAQQVYDDHGLNGLPRRDIYMLRTLKDYCKTAKINIPVPKSPPIKRKTATSSVATQTDAVVTRCQETQYRYVTATRGTMTDALHQTEILITKPAWSTNTQSKNSVKMKNQGTQHKNPTTTRGTTTASFIKQHDVGTCFPEPEPANIRKILDEMLNWHKIVQPLSPIRDFEPNMLTSSLKPSMSTIGTCTYICNVHREINFITAMPAPIKRSNSRPPSRSMFDAVKDESNSSYEYNNVTRELFGMLPCPQTCMNNVLSNPFDELWQVFGQMVLGLLQQRFNTTVPAAHNLNQVDFTNWLYSLYESSKIEAATKNTAKTVAYETNYNKDYVANNTEQMNMCAMPIIETPPPKIGIDLTPIRLASKPKPKKRKAGRKPRVRAKRNAKDRGPRETAINFLSNLNIFHEQDYNMVDADLDEEERILLSLTASDKQHDKVHKTADESNLIELSCETVPDPVVHNSRKFLESGDFEIQSETIIQSKTNLRDTQSSINSSSNHIADSDAQNEDCTDTPEPEVELRNNCIGLNMQCAIDTETQFSQHKSVSAALKQGNTQVSKKYTNKPKNICLEFGNDSDSEQTESQPKVSIENGAHKNVKVQLAAIDSDVEDELRNSLYKCNGVTDTPNMKCADETEYDTTEGQFSKYANVSAAQEQAILRVSEVNTEDPKTMYLELFGNGSDSDQSESETLEAPIEKGEDENPESPLSAYNSDFEIIESQTCDKLNEEKAPNELESCAYDKQVESPDSGNLVIDEDDENGNVNIVTASDDSVMDSVKDIDEYSCTSSTESISSISTQSRKRKRKADAEPKIDLQPECKRLTRFRAKQLEQLCMREQALASVANDYKSQEPESTTNINCDTILVETKPATGICSTSISKSANHFSLDESPASPIPETSFENIGTSPIEIPVDQPAYIKTTCEPKALMSHILDWQSKEQGCLTQVTDPLIDLQLVTQITKYLNDSMFTESSCSVFITELYKITDDDCTISNAFITSISKIKDNERAYLERLITTIRYLELRQPNCIHRLINTLEERLFRPKEKPKAELAHRYIKLHMQLIALQTELTDAELYTNPARLLIIKILQQYQTDAPLLVLEVLNHYPTVLPHREDRSYNNDDPLITVIKHLLMSHRYNMEDPNSADRILLSKLRFEYHFQPFEPTKHQVLENMVDKLKSGKVQELSLAFALFCRRSPTLKVVEEVLTPQLMPLANSYLDVCAHTEEHDVSIVAILTCISMIVKQLQLETDISIYVALFKRFLLAGPRPCLQQAAAQAILRLQRFGFKYIMDALSGYKPSYELTPMTRAMMRSLGARRLQYKRSFIKPTRSVL